MIITTDRLFPRTVLYQKVALKMNPREIETHFTLTAATLPFVTSRRLTFGWEKDNILLVN
jgi:hypothetical protein